MSPCTNVDSPVMLVLKSSIIAAGCVPSKPGERLIAAAVRLVPMIVKGTLGDFVVIQKILYE